MTTCVRPSRFVIVRMAQLNAQETFVNGELCSNQEEADTKYLLHVKHGINAKTSSSGFVQSPAGDIDIPKV